MSKPIEIINKGSIGIITDGDAVSRPKGSCSTLVNFDYDSENNLIKTRNNTVSANLLDGFTMPSGYEIMAGGLQTFSFNAPIDRQIILLFIKHAINGDVRIYVNTWYNPPSDSVSGGLIRRYENYISGVSADTWHNEWIELTEYSQLERFVIASNTTFTADGATGDPDRYRGWFVWNATKWASGTTDQIKNESFICIESYDGTTFTIQDRYELTFPYLGWADDDEIYIMRYPIIVHKAISTVAGSVNLRMSFTPNGRDWIKKTNSSVKCLIGQDGNLWFGFVNKDVTELPANNNGTEETNVQKRYGWWLDYEQFPIITKQDGFTFNTSPYDLIFDSKIGIKLNLKYTSGTAIAEHSQLFAVSVDLDNTQRVGIFYGYEDIVTANHYLNYKFKAYHNYSRRITALRTFASKDTEPIDSPHTIYNRVIGEVYKQPEVENPFWYSFYEFGRTAFPTATQVTFFIIDMERQDGTNLDSILEYDVKKAIYTADNIGVLSKDILLTAGDSKKPDKISYSLIQDGVVSEDIFPLRNSSSIGGSDKDKLTGLVTLGDKVVAIKNNSLHIILPLDDGSGFRTLGSITKVGTSYNKTVVETTLGLVFANEDGIFLYDLNKPINILEGYRLQEYYSLNKDLIFAEWHSTRKEAWFYVGNGKVWILNISNKGQIGWNDYQFPNSWNIIDFITDEDKNFYIVTTSNAIRFKKDNEVTDAFDVGNVGIPYDYRQNFEVVDVTRGRRWKIIETKIYCELQARSGLIPDGNIEVINVEFYRNGETTPYRTKTIKVNASFDLPKTLTIRNNVSNSQRTHSIRVYGTLNYLKRLSISEVYSRAVLLTQQIKEGIYEQEFIQ